MDAVIRVFKCVAGLSKSAGTAELFGAAGVVFCSIRLLVASTQGINLIGKQGSLIKSIQESTAASVRVLSGEEVPFYVAADERIIEMQGETLKYTAPVSQERQPDPWADKSLLHTATQTGGGTNYPLTATRESLFLSRESQLESQLPSSGLSIYGQEASLSSIHSSGLGRPSAPIVTQITQTMQIPLSYAEDIIGVEGRSIEFICRSSGALLTVQESRGLPDEITVEIKGTSSQVQAAQQLIQEVIATSNKDQIPSSYGRMDTGLRSSYSQLDSISYPSSSVSSLP
ncbi:RNA-binding KH domain-containing protein PEPPER isoform X4 [Rosa chinensis]|uniref:RNA-binding KH domain-containing protein PEPPER isoform X4 n=1 Tax=Rosa chinensis TaxID=74649 RepID=UPI001AD92A49|nr:RNA-binding KH domain-containing protein PEPPER isoform X4 [Rosa chinensis]